MKCPICSATSVRLFERHRFWIRGCSSCEHRFADLEPRDDHVATVYADGYFLSGGDGYPDYRGEARLITRHGRFYGKLLRKYMNPGEVLDVGAACGFILQGLTEHGWRGSGVEPNAGMVEYARENGLDLSVGTLEDFPTSREFDLVSMVQVIGHFHDVRRALRVAATLTRPRGYWLIETWDKDSWFAKLQKENWHEYSPPSVLQYFSRTSLTRLVQQYGLELVAIGRPPKEISPLHVQSLARHKSKDSIVYRMAGSVASCMPSKWTLPYPSFDLFWALFRMT